jgi:hypothetical protein
MVAADRIAAVVAIVAEEAADTTVAVGEAALIAAVVVVDMPHPAEAMVDTGKRVEGESGFAL